MIDDWKKMFNKGNDSKITINLRNILKSMYRNKVDYDNVFYSLKVDYDKKQIIVSLKQSKDE